MDSKQTFSFGARHHSNTHSINEYEKRNPKTSKIVTVREENVIFVVDLNHKLLISK